MRSMRFGTRVMSNPRRPAFVWLVVSLSAVYIAYLVFTIYVVASHSFPRAVA